MLTWDGTEARPVIADAIWFYRQMQLDAEDPRSYDAELDSLLRRWLAASD